MTTVIPSTLPATAQNEITKAIKAINLETGNFDGDEKDICEPQEHIEFAEDSKEEIDANEEEQDIECEDETEFDAEFFDQEMEEALENVRNLAKIHQHELVNNICDTFSFMTGEQASVNDISAIFGRIKNDFANEANEDNEDYEDECSDSSDDDYDENNFEDRQQIEKDFDSDYFADDQSEEDAEDEEDEEKEKEDADYDENNDEDMKQYEEDQKEDFSESEESEVSDEDYCDESAELDEEAIINGDDFDGEYFEAIAIARKAGAVDHEKMLKKIKEKYEYEIGEQVTNELIADALKQFASDEDEDEDENEENVEMEEVEENTQKENPYLDTGLMQNLQQFSQKQNEQFETSHQQ